MKSPLSSLVLCMLLPVTLLGATSAQALTYTVGPGGSYGTIQAAINAALAHAGDDDVRVHIGVYNESLSVPVTMTSNELLISGGWEDGFVTQATNGALNTIVSPGPNLHGAQIKPSGGLVTLSDFQFYGAATSDGGAGVRVQSTVSASVHVLRNLFRQNVVETTVSASGGGLFVDAHGSGEVLIQGNDFDANRAAISSGTGTIAGGSIAVNCYDSTYCVVTDNALRNSFAESISSPVYGGAMWLNVGGTAAALFERNLIEGLTIGAQSGQMAGRSLTVSASASATVIARGNQLRSGAPLGGAFSGYESYWSLNGQAVATFSDSLVAKSPLRAVYAYVVDSSRIHLVNLTLMDNVSDVYINSASSNSSSTSNCLIGSAFAGNTFNGTVLENNRYGLTLPFLAPSLYDYGLRRPDPQIADAGTDTPIGGLGTIDITNGARKVGAHVDVGAWESSDRIFADRVDN